MSGQANRSMVNGELSPSTIDRSVLAALVFSLSALTTACGGSSNSSADPEARVPVADSNDGKMQALRKRWPRPAPAPAPTTYSATVTWAVPSLNTDGTVLTDVASYRIRYGSSIASLTASVSVNGATSTSATVNGLTAGTYYFSVAVVNASGVASSDSTPVTISVP